MEAATPDLTQSDRLNQYAKEASELLELFLTGFCTHLIVNEIVRSFHKFLLFKYLKNNKQQKKTKKQLLIFKTKHKYIPVNKVKQR